MLMQRVVLLAIILGLASAAHAQPDPYDPAPPRGTGWIMKGMDGARMGVVLPLAKERSFVPSLHLALETAINFDWWELCLGGGVMVGLGGSDRALQGLLLEVGVRRYLANWSVAPFVGAGISPRFLIYEGRHFALAPHLAVGGLKALERSWVTFELRAAQHVVPVKSDTGDQMYPTEVGVFAGYWW